MKLNTIGAIKLLSLLAIGVVVFNANSIFRLNNQITDLVILPEQNLSQPAAAYERQKIPSRHKITGKYGSVTD